MKLVCRVAVAVAALALVPAAPASAQSTQPSSPSQDSTAQQTPAGQKPEQKPDEPQKYEDTVVVSASRTEEKLVNAPATMTVIGAQQIQDAASQNFANLLRHVPGLNITQASARDINVTTRGATSTLATGQLALLDGRSLYQDFFGFVMWDMLPVNLDEIKQIEVIRGPASAVWGANALFGVVNVITKSPRELAGTTFTLGVGAFDRSAGASSQGAGSLFYVSGTHAQALNGRWAYKVSAGAYLQDALPRPTGQIPCDNASVCTGATNSYPPFPNSGTTQPKFDGRLDYDYPDGRQLSFSGGVAGTKGVMESGIGPFNINNGSVMGYGKVDYSRKGLRASAFTNVLNGNANNLLTTDPRGNPILFDFRTRTYDVNLSNVHTFAARHVVTYGGNLRYNAFDLSLAPGADNRTEGGAYVQDEMFLGNRFTWVLGGRVDRFDYLDSFVFSPRTTLMIKPYENQTIRVSYNRAYRSPSVVNNFLDVTVAEPIDLTPFSAVIPSLRGRVFPLGVQSVGNPNLKETTLDAFEIGYTGVVGRSVASAAFYVNETKNDILFTENLDARYTALNPPPGWVASGLPPALLAFIPGGLPAQFTYLNFGRTTQKGLELGLDTTVNTSLGLFVNYSFQPTPVPHGFPLSELNLPPKHRFNIGFDVTRDRFLGNLSVAYTGSAFWQDVLDERYHGTTGAYTLVNGGAGIRWANRKLTTSVKVMNLLNRDIQQHVFGDILKRQVVGELKVNF